MSDNTSPAKEEAQTVGQPLLGMLPDLLGDVSVSCKERGLEGFGKTCDNSALAIAQLLARCAGLEKALFSAESLCIDINTPPDQLLLKIAGIARAALSPNPEANP